jgi:hypothetical protein
MIGILLSQSITMRFFSRIKTLSPSEICFEVICTLAGKEHTLVTEAVINNDTSIRFPKEPCFLGAFATLIWGVLKYAPDTPVEVFSDAIKSMLSCDEYHVNKTINISSLPLQFYGGSLFTNDMLDKCNLLLSCFAQGIHAPYGETIGEFKFAISRRSKSPIVAEFCKILSILPETLRVSEIFGEYDNVYSVSSYIDRQAAVRETNIRINDMKAEKINMRSRIDDLSAQCNSIIRNNNVALRAKEEYIREIKEKAAVKHEEAMKEIDELKKEIKSLKSELKSSKKRKLDEKDEPQRNSTVYYVQMPASGVPSFPLQQFAAQPFYPPQSQFIAPQQIANYQPQAQTMPQQQLASSMNFIPSQITSHPMNYQHQQQ